MTINLYQFFGTPSWAQDIQTQLGLILANQGKTMAAIDDLKAAIASLVTEAVTDLESVIAKLGTTPPDDTAALQALTQQASDATAKLKSDMAALTAPAPAPAPTTP